tara:strand:- start:669 stop:905 length:237 start_codon:yes stop_codon:yes gene_type:complete
MEHYLEIKATVVLSEMSVDVEFEVEDKDWLFSDDIERSKIIWDFITEKYPVNMTIALNMINKYPKSSYVHSWTYNHYK